MAGSSFNLGHALSEPLRNPGQVRRLAPATRAHGWRRRSHWPGELVAALVTSIFPEEMRCLLLKLGFHPLQHSNRPINICSCLVVGSQIYHRMRTGVGYLASIRQAHLFPLVVHCRSESRKLFFIYMSSAT